MSMHNKRRWSKEDLDNTFEAFLKTSLSSEDDTEKIKQLLDKPIEKKELGSSAFWWTNDSDDDSFQKDTQTGKGKSFLKSKKSDSPVRSKTTAETTLNGKLSKSPARSSEDLIGTAITSTPKQMTASPRKAPRKEKSKGKRETSAGKARGSRPKVETSMSKDSLEDISEKSEEQDVSAVRGKEENVIAVHDSSIDTSVSYEGVMAHQSRERPGFDTLDELDDKKKFFQNIENDADGTVDYGRLNQELSQTGTAMISPGTKQMLLADESFGVSDSAGGMTPSRNPNLDVTSDSSKQKPSMLSKVALMDSMDSTLNTTTSPKVINSRDTTQENLGATIPETLKTQGTSGLSGPLGTNTSKEMEDLQRVLQEAGMSPTIFPGDSRPPTGKASDQMASGQQNRNDPVGDILRKIDAIERKGREIELKEDRIQLRSDYQSPRTPRTPRSPGLVRQAPLDDLGGFDNSHTEDTEIYQPVTAVSIKEKPKPTKRKDLKPVPKTTVEERAHTARDRFAHVQSSGYGRSLSPPASRKHRSKSAGKSPVRQHSGQQLAKSGKSSLKTTTMEIRHAPLPPDSLHSTHQDVSSQDMYFRQSIETYARHIKDHYETQAQRSSDQIRSEWLQRPGHEREAGLMEELKDLREQWSQERTQKTKLQADLLAQERDFTKQLETQKLQYEDQVFSLKQENFVLASKLKELEKESKDKVGSPAERSSETEVDKGRVTRLERDIQEQESLLTGYQAENKRLYEEMKGMQRQAKTTESSMFKENQRLTSELANLKQELELRETELKNKGIITSVAVQQQIAAGNAEAALSVSRIAHLEGELAEAKRVQDNQNHELKLMHQTKFELEKHIDTLASDKDSLAKELCLSLKPEQVKDLELRHKDEVEKIARKLKWYTENQELLDKSSAKLRAKEDEIHRLKMRLEDFKSEAGRKMEENKLRVKEKTADNKKIQDLERQVKEMEQVIRRRHPNSLPAMMMVAATVPDAAIDESGSKGRSVQVLEARIKKLEKELETKNELEHQDLRAMEQKYNQVKFHFEERIADLERQLAVYEGCPTDGQMQGRPHSHAIALQRELESIRERNKKQVSMMQSEVDRLTAELNKVQKNQDNMMKNESRRSENEWKQQILSLQKELQDREHDIQLSQHTVEKMRRKSENPKKKNGSQKTGQGQTEWPPFPHAPSATRQYQPDHFADSDMSSLLHENQRLKTQLDQVQLELDQQRVDLRRSLAETEAAARLNKERLENQIEDMRNNHQRELQRMQAEQALLSSSARVTELQNKCDAQEVMIRHLQVQLKRVSSEAECVPQLKARESKLQGSIDELQAKLRDAKSVHAPEMRHFESLENKLVDLVERQRRREVELDSMVKQNRVSSRQELEEEIEKWKKLVENKNQQLQVFRAELDSILEILKTLQRQGVTLPVSAIYS